MYIAYSDRRVYPKDFNVDENFQYGFAMTGHLPINLQGKFQMILGIFSLSMSNIMLKKGVKEPFTLYLWTILIQTLHYFNKSKI